MFHALSKLFGGKARRAQRQAATAVRRQALLDVEALEGRVVPASISHELHQGALIIWGTSGNDTAKITLVDHKYHVTRETNGVKGSDIVVDDTAITDHRVIFVGDAGDDTFTNATNTLTADMYGLDGNDRLTGGGLNDKLEGGNGSDVLDGGAGNDTLTGEAGVDFLFGGAGDDTLSGGIGNDNLQGENGKDTLFGGDGNDYLSGGAGDDILRGELGDDLMYGYAGNDQLFGSDGIDTLFGGDGNDLLSGDAGNDDLHGEAGFDQLYGGSENDTLDGGKDGIADYMNGGIGADKFKGEWVLDNPIFVHYKNLDAPADFNLAEGDVVDSPYVITTT